MTKDQFRKKLGEVIGKPERRTTPKRNRNGQQGICRANNYEYIPFAPRKRCYNYDSCNHLAIDCRKNKKNPKAIHKSDVDGKTMKVKQENPCILRGSYWHSLNTCFDYHDNYENYYDPVPKFYKCAGADKTFDKKHAPCSSNKSVSDETDTHKMCGTRKVYVIKNSKHVKRIQQVWILKSSN